MITLLCGCIVRGITCSAACGKCSDPGHSARGHWRAGVQNICTKHARCSKHGAISRYCSCCRTPVFMGISVAVCPDRIGVYCKSGRHWIFVNERGRVVTDQRQKHKRKAGV